MKCDQDAEGTEQDIKSKNQLQCPLVDKLCTRGTCTLICQLLMYVCICHPSLVLTVMWRYSTAKLLYEH